MLLYKFLLLDTSVCKLSVLDKITCYKTTCLKNYAKMYI